MNLALLLASQDAPFFTVKLNIKMLPCVIMFKQGQAVGQVVGFEGLGATDDFDTAALEDQFHQAEVGEREMWGRAREQWGACQRTHIV